MELKKLSSELDRINYFKNISLKSVDTCLKSFDSDELSEEEEKCLKKAALNLHFIVERNKFDHYARNGMPPQPW
jgi:hypothetical protein